MVDSTTRGGGRITVDERAEGSGDALQTVMGEVGDLAVEGSIADFDLATLLTQVPAPITALNLDARRAAFHRQLAAVLIELEATLLGVRAAAFAYRQAEKGISEVFGGLLDALGWAAGRALAMSLPVLIPVALVIGGQVIAVAKILDATGLDDLIVRHWGIDLGKTKAQAKEALIKLVFENSDASGAVIEHVLPGIVVGFMGLPPGALDSKGGHAFWPHDSQSMTIWVLAGANLFGLLLPSDVEVWRAKGLTPPHTEPPRDVEDLYIREANCHLGADSGQVRIEEIVGPDGTVRYIVYVPATTDWSPKSGDNTTDLTTNVQGMAGNDTVMREMVRQAIADAGIGRRAEVMLVGYSQGGITAGSLAADPAFLGDVNVTALMTVGAPVSDFPSTPTSTYSPSNTNRTLYPTSTEARIRQLTTGRRSPSTTTPTNCARPPAWRTRPMPNSMRCSPRRCRALVHGLRGLDRAAAAGGTSESQPLHREEFGVLHRRSQTDPRLSGQTPAHLSSPTSCTGRPGSEAPLPALLKTISSGGALRRSAAFGSALKTGSSARGRA
jgi:hypothetical protein